MANVAGGKKDFSVSPSCWSQQNKPELIEIDTDAVHKQMNSPVNNNTTDILPRAESSMFPSYFQFTQLIIEKQS